MMRLEISPQGSTQSRPLYEVVVLQVLVHATRLKKRTDSILSYSNQPAVNARAALVMDAQTGEVLYSKNSNTVTDCLDY
jgi:D-alanyl-D-alanine endopeptidase (penicillin-binding protein 7)